MRDIFIGPGSAGADRKDRGDDEHTSDDRERKVVASMWECPKPCRHNPSPSRARELSLAGRRGGASVPSRNIRGVGSKEATAQKKFELDVQRYCVGIICKRREMPTAARLRRRG
jgi:hypothetical protein